MSFSPAAPLAAVQVVLTEQCSHNQQLNPLVNDGEDTISRDQTRLLGQAGGPLCLATLASLGDHPGPLLGGSPVSHVQLARPSIAPTVMAVAASENNVEPRAISFKGAKQAVTAFAPKLEAAPPDQRAGLVGALLTVVAYHRVGNRPGRWEPRARKRRPKPGKRLTQPRRVAKLAHNRTKWY
jgi:hypothetical protein